MAAQFRDDYLRLLQYTEVLAVEQVVRSLALNLSM